MLNIEKIHDGIVVDRIRTGLGVKIFNWLGLDKTTDTVALALNVASKKIGKKDLIKIDNNINIDLNVLGLIDPNITVNIIENEVITKKIKLKLPEEVRDVLKCNNPRCVAYGDTLVPDVFKLFDEKKHLYRCVYCDTILSAESFE